MKERMRRIGKTRATPPPARPFDLAQDERPRTGDGFPCRGTRMTREVRVDLGRDASDPSRGIGMGGVRWGGEVS